MQKKIVWNDAKAVNLTRAVHLVGNRRLKISHPLTIMSQITERGSKGTETGKKLANGTFAISVASCEIDRKQVILWISRKVSDSEALCIWTNDTMSTLIEKRSKLIVSIIYDSDYIFQHRFCVGTTGKSHVHISGNSIPNPAGYHWHSE